ncbi:restriction endonuclease subunit S [Legionella pneumophila serogroup 1]
MSYLSYKDSGTTWLGKIPQNWEAKRLKYIITYNDESLPETTRPDRIINYVDISSVSLMHGIENVDRYEFDQAPSRARRIVKNGDTILSTVRTYLKAIALIKGDIENLIVSTGFMVIRPTPKVDSIFLNYFMQSEAFIGEIVARSVGVSYPAINPSEVAKIESVIPPLNEQRHIAIFLDKKTSELDALIAKKQKLIQLLEEKRSALIAQTVTKGLEPNLPMKDSGVNWLGKIPDCWDLKRIKFYVRSINKKIHYENTKLPYLGLENIESWTGKKIEDDSVSSEGVVCCFEAKDVLFGKLRPYLAKTYLAKDDGTCSTEFLVFRPCAYVDPEYLQYFLLSPKFINTVNASTYGAKMPRANWEFIANLYLTCPSLLVQKQIIQFLNDETVKIDLIKTKIKDAIERLKEYRAALITNAVTGKIALTAEKDKRFAYE